ncbi:MAG: ABC transporter ATP-binding protein [Pseudomonadota bacterium]
MQLTIHNLSRRLGDRNVLDDVSLSLTAGHIACLLGASGCGKTTLLRCVAGFETLDAGHIELNGETVATVHSQLAPHARQVGMVFQDHALFPHLSIAQNVAFGLHTHTKAAAAKRVSEVLEWVGLSTLGERFPHQLSGGQQQRAALARALAPQPRLLLLDEPFASLDRALRYRLVHDVGQILRASGTTALWVTHDPREALQAADVLGVMNAGRIAQWDAPARLFEQPTSIDVARTLGDCAVLEGRLRAGNVAQTAIGDLPLLTAPASENTHVNVLVRPEQLSLVPMNAGAGHLASAQAQVRDVWYHGHQSIAKAVLSGGEEVRVRVHGGDVPEGPQALVWIGSHTIAFLP